MGDIADYVIEQGMDHWHAHLAGDCGPDPCQYCEKEESI